MRFAIIPFAALLLLAPFAAATHTTHRDQQCALQQGAPGVFAQVCGSQLIDMTCATPNACHTVETDDGIVEVQATPQGTYADARVTGHDAHDCAYSETDPNVCDHLYVDVFAVRVVALGVDKSAGGYLVTTDHEDSRQTQPVGPFEPVMGPCSATLVVFAPGLPAQFVAPDPTLCPANVFGQLALGKPLYDASADVASLLP